MTASQEIEHLQSLKGDTYFAQVFKPETIEAMCENIRKDFAIDCGIDLFENCHSVVKARAEAKILKGQLEERENEVEDLREQKSSVADFLIELSANIDGPLHKAITDKVVEMLGWKETIKRKLKIGISLCNEEKDWLLNNL